MPELSTSPSLRSSEGRYNIKSDYGADPLGTNDSYNAINNALQTVPTSVGGIVYGPPGDYLLSLPLKIYRTTDTSSSIAPSILGSAQGGDNPSGNHASTRFTANNTFPIGEYMIDYLGSQAQPFAALTGYKIGNLALRCQSRAAGIRQINHQSSRLFDIIIGNGATPAPANITGTPVGAICCASQGANDYSWQNILNRVVVESAANDGLQLTELNGSNVSAFSCFAVSAGRWGYNVSDVTDLIGCKGQTCVVADFHINGHAVMLIGCGQTGFGPVGNALILGNPAALNRTASIIGGAWMGTNSAGTAANTTLIRAAFEGNLRYRFVGCTFRAGSQTSYWLYIEAGNSGRITFSSCDFNDTQQPITGKLFLGGTTASMISFRDCPGIITEASGHASPAIGLNQTVIVNHTLDLIPSIDNIILTAQSSLFGATSFDVSNVTATQFTITVRGTSAGTAPIIGWRASLNAD